MSLAKKFRRRTRLEQADLHLMMKDEQLEKLERLSACYEKALRQIQSGENWTTSAQDEEDTSQWVWIGEDHPQKIAEKSLSEALKIVKGFDPSKQGVKDELPEVPEANEVAPDNQQGQQQN